MRSAVRICPVAPKSIENFGFWCFFVAKTPKMLRVKMWVKRCPHRDPHWLAVSALLLTASCPMGTRKCADRFKEHRRGGFAPSPIFLMFFFCSHHLCHEAAHGLCGFVLLLPCSVGVGAEGETRIIVPQHGGHRLYVHTVL